MEKMVQKCNKVVSSPGCVVIYCLYLYIRKILRCSLYITPVIIVSQDALPLKTLTHQATGRTVSGRCEHLSAKFFLQFCTAGSCADALMAHVVGHLQENA